MGPGVSQNRYKQVVETNKYRQDGCKCGSTLTSHENDKKVAGIDQNHKNGSNCGSMLRSHENHWKVEEIG